MCSKAVGLLARITFIAFVLCGFAAFVRAQTGLSALNQIDADKIASVKKNLTADLLSDAEVQDAIAIGATGNNAVRTLG